MIQTLGNLLVSFLIGFWLGLNIGAKYFNNPKESKGCGLEGRYGPKGRYRHD